MSPLALFGGLLLAAAVLGGKSKTGRGDAVEDEDRGPELKPPPPFKPVDQLVLDAAMRACIEEAAPEISARITWNNAIEQQAWAVKLKLAGFTKAGQCVGLNGLDLVACIAILHDAVAADLRAMAEPRKGAVAFTQLANKLDVAGFPEASACFRADGPRPGLVRLP